MPLCIVPSCKNRSDSRGWKKRDGRNTDSKVSFHRFPNKAHLAKLWIDILDIKSPIPPGARICSAHFAPESFDKSSPLTIRLRPQALPNKLPEASSSLATLVVECKVEQDSVPQILHRVNQVTSPVRSKPILIDRATSPIIALSTPQPSTSKEDKATMISPDIVYNSPGKRILRQRINTMKNEYSKKIRALQQNLRRSTSRIAELKNTVDHLKQKNFLNEEQNVIY